MIYKNSFAHQAYKYHNFSIKPPRGLIDFKHSKGGLIGERGLIREGGLIYFFKYKNILSSTIQLLVSYINIIVIVIFINYQKLTGQRFIEDSLVLPGKYCAYSDTKQIITVLHKELEKKVASLIHMNITVEQP